MPLYEYLCKDCEHRFEELRSFSVADEAKPCPHCGSLNNVRQLSKVNSVSDGRSLSNKRTCGGCHTGNCASCGG